MSAGKNGVLSNIRIEQGLVDTLHKLHQRFLNTLPKGRRLVLRDCDLR
jgi:hypothetical protein